MFQRDGYPAGVPCFVDSVDATAAAVWAAGGSVLTEPMDVFAAGRMAICADPQGAAFGIWQAGRHRGAQLVNAPGSWNWSNLQTRDVDGARAFYGAVFGWQPAPVRLGPSEASALGGAIVTAAHDAGPTRIAALRDQQGATFSVSTYSPG